ncbi:Arm DNA-binding domain-containing protein, partial [Enterobacter roggenkampii]
DERGLYLLVKSTGDRYWRIKYRIAGKEKKLALGVYHDVSLDEARIKREDARKIFFGRGQLTFASVRQVLAQGWLQSTPYVTEHDLVARILHTELGSGHHADGQPLDALQLA